jgi:hypothetical protein
MAGNSRAMVKERLERYLKKDGNGVRKTILQIFLNGGSHTTGEIYEALAGNGFNMSNRSVSAMVGLMNSRIGILSININTRHNTYAMKEDYADVVKGVIENY